MAADTAHGMISTIQIVLALLAVLAAADVIAGRLKIPASILLVLIGAALALIPGLPAMELAPELVLLLVLPPVIYWAAISMSWKEFRFNLRPIALLAVGCVVFSTVAVAAATHWLLDFPWAVGFVVGAIVAPPDAVAPLSIARRMQIPRRILVVLEGEGLVNDATALIFYRFAVAAVASGMFSLGEAVGTFGAIVVSEIIWGIGVGWVLLRLRRWVAEPRIEMTLAVITPYLSYWPPEYLGGSGVLATVCCGLYISWTGPRLISAATRLQGVFFWGLFIYLIEGMIFLITGLQARTLIARIGDYALRELLVSAALVIAVLIAARFVWMYPATYLPRLSARIRVRDPAPPWQWPFALAFTGVRGIVSLAAALGIPFTTVSGQPFPHRDLILFLTFSVILVTLVVQGLMMPAVMRALGLANAGRQEHDDDRAEERQARLLAVEAAAQRLAQLAGEHGLAPSVVTPLQQRQRERRAHIEHGGDGDAARRRLSELDDELEMALIAAERDAINRMFREGRLKDEARRRIERELDLREAHLANGREG